MESNRDPNGRFIKGVSGNPGGRPKEEFDLPALIDSVVTVADWKAIIQILLRKSKRGDLKAIDMLCDRRFGKAQQFTDLTSNGEKIVVTLKGEDA